MITPREMKNAITINQIVGLANPESVSPIGRVPEPATTAIAVMHSAPMGSGLRMIARMVATKMANRCHACEPSPS